jgi:Autographiviridae endonuclease VII
MAYKNIETQRAARRSWLDKNPLWNAEYHQRRRLARWGLTPESYEALAAQGCRICGTLDPGTPHRRFCMDHDHETGKFRGLLCNRHNLALGHFRDSIEEMWSALAYLGESANLG